MLYDGFFDATKIDENGPDESSNYDRTYDSGDFVDYFANFIGSGVCIRDNPDSFKATYQGGTLTLAPGYLFIQGFWLKNDDNHDIPLSTAGVYAVVARLDTGKRMIDLTVEEKASDYASDTTLVLAYVTVSSGGTGNVEDTRYNTDVCSIIDSAGSLSTKIEWAINYINTEIDSRLDKAEQDIANQAAKLDAKIAEVSAVVDKLEPPAVGTIKFSASKDVGEDWLPCDGRFVSEKDYPELVEALGKLTPSSDKFQLISDGEIGQQISNGVIYGGRMWVYSYSTGKLYGVDLSGSDSAKEISISISDGPLTSFSPPSTQYPICLSIIPHKSGTGAKLFLGQFKGGIYNTSDYAWTQYLLLLQTEFTGSESTLTLSIPFIAGPSWSVIPASDRTIFIPYVISLLKSGVETYLCGLGYYTQYASGNNNSYRIQYFEFNDSDVIGATISITQLGANTSYQRTAFNPKTKDEAVVFCLSNAETNGYFYSRIYSAPTGAIEFAPDQSFQTTGLPTNSRNALNIVGNTKMICGFDINQLPVVGLQGQGPQFNITRHGLVLPSAARVFVDGGAYLWGKDIYMIFVGTGIIFSRTLEEGSFGYLDTTSVLGTITQFGYLDYSQDDGTLYLLGQDTTNNVKVAKIVLNTLYDYANDGAWLPTIAADGVPAYIKALPTDVSVGTKEPHT